MFASFYSLFLWLKRVNKKKQTHTLNARKENKVPMGNTINAARKLASNESVNSSSDSETLKVTFLSLVFSFINLFQNTKKLNFYRTKCRPTLRQTLLRRCPKKTNCPHTNQLQKLPKRLTYLQRWVKTPLTIQLTKYNHLPQLLPYLMKAKNNT